MSQFHFIEPLWFLALAPLGLLLWVARRADTAGSAWRRVVDPRLLAVLRGGGNGQERWRPLALLAVGWSLAVLALANPTFERKPVPAFRPDAARVVVLDLSRSMLAADLTPSRLERARYKVADILTRSADGQVGLVAFAGDAFAVSPLTDDAETIRSMLDALSPQVMPVQGSRPDLGIALGQALLTQAGARNGEVILLTDDAGGASARAAAQSLHEAGYRLGVIGVGTPEGAPVPGVTRSNGPVISRLEPDALARLARTGAGLYATLTTSDEDLDLVLSEPGRRSHAVAERDPQLAERWHELGPWVLLPLVPLAALAFRRGWLMVLIVLVAQGAFLVPMPARAFGWADLWQRPDQQAAEALSAGDAQRARELARAPARAGSAAYRLGEFQDAAEQFAAGERAVDHYNRGNALARSGRLEEAIAAYDAALARDPSLADAEYNRAQVAQALERQQRAQSGQSGADSDADSGEPASAEADRQQAQSGGEAGGEPGATPDSGQPKDPADSSVSNERASDQPTGREQAAGEQDAAGDSASDAPARRASPSAQGQAGKQGDPDASLSRSNEERAAETEAGSTALSNQQNAAAAPQDGGARARSEVQDAVDAAEAERAAADYREEAAKAGSGTAQGAEDAPSDASPDALGASAERTAQAREARQAAEQWLRRIPDDPAELLRRKFRYQYRERPDQPDALASGEPW
ncbi:MAG: VWA domain-containing protein [Gammaproteobacteria bacterium]|nr:VWA domain-containing protein [Gammaproteobacteria bacterium]